MKFNERLMQLRKEKGLSQEQLAEKISVARQTISKWELGETTPEMEKIVKLSEVFEISLDELLQNSNVKKQITEHKEEINQTNTQKLAGWVIILLKVFLLIVIVGIVVTIICFGFFSSKTKTKLEVKEELYDGIQNENINTINKP